MKNFALLAAVSCIALAATTDADESVKEKLQSCVKATGWSKEELSANCASDLPTDEAALATHKEWIACVLETVGIVQGSDSGVTVNMDTSTKLTPSEKASEIMSKCAARSKVASTVTDAAMEIYRCFRDNDKDEYTAECQAFVATL